MDPKTPPCYTYFIRIYEANDNGLAFIEMGKIYRPEETNFVYNSNFSGKYQITVRCDTISNDYVTKTINPEI